MITIFRKSLYNFIPVATVILAPILKALKFLQCNPQALANRDYIKRNGCLFLYKYLHFIKRSH